MNRWFTRYLHGVENGVEDDPRAFIVREKKRPSEPTAYPDYPNPEASRVELRLTAGGKSHGSLTQYAVAEQGRESLTDNVEISGSELAAAAESGHRLMYVSPVLTEDLHLSGATKLSIKVASDKPAVNLSIWMVSLPWKEEGRGNDNIITRGWADPQNYRSLRKSEPLVPGKFYELSFDLQPDDQIIPAGQQIGLMIFASDRDFTLWPEPGTELSVDLDGTLLVLPVVGGESAYHRAVSPAK
jgi:X-Pro dipeptidyl-peptidase